MPHNKPNVFVLKYYFQLTKFWVSFAISFTAFAGFLMASKTFTQNLFYLTFGVLLMAMGASALNQVLERKSDALMERTKNRPVPSGRMSISKSTSFGLFLLLTGLLLILTINVKAALWGVFNAFWYLLVYTPLKKTTVWALLLGTITGAVPFLMGFFAANSVEPITRPLFVCFFLVIWQVPHFLLMVCKYGKQYSNAGLASLSVFWSKNELINISLIWIAASSVSIMLVPFYNITQNRLVGFFLLAMSTFVLATVTYWLFTRKENFKLFYPLGLVYLFQFVFMTLLSIDSIL